MKKSFTARDLAYWIALAAILCAWWVDRSRLNSETAEWTSEFYRLKSRWKMTAQPYGGLYPEGMRAQVLRTGRVLDSTTIDGRREIAKRLKEEDCDFLLRKSVGEVISGIEGGWVHNTLDSLPTK